MKTDFMGRIELKISEASSISEVRTDVLIIKNILDGVYGPEKEIDQITNGAVKKLNKKEFCQIGKITRLKNATENADCVLLMGVGEIELIDYDAIRFAFCQAFKFVSKNFNSLDSIATVIHGVGFGLEKKDVFIPIIKALIDADERNVDFKFKQLIINENGIVGEPEILSYINDLISIGSNLFSQDGNEIYINTKNENLRVDTESSEIKKNVRAFLIKGEIIDAIEQLRKLNSEVLAVEIDRVVVV